MKADNKKGSQPARPVTQRAPVSDVPCLQIWTPRVSLAQQAWPCLWPLATTLHPERRWHVCQWQLHDALMLVFLSLPARPGRYNEHVLPSALQSDHTKCTCMGDAVFPVTPLISAHHLTAHLMRGRFRLECACSHNLHCSNADSESAGLPGA